MLDRDYACPLDVPTMARAALMSPAHFSRRFREAFGETPYGYLQTRRFERAMALLRRGDLSVTEVCMEVGFGVDQHFPQVDQDAMRELVAKGDLAVFLQVDDVDQVFESLRAAGAEILQEPTDQPDGICDCSVRDPS